MLCLACQLDPHSLGPSHFIKRKEVPRISYLRSHYNKQAAQGQAEEEREQYSAGEAAGGVRTGAGGKETGGTMHRCLRFGCQEFRQTGRPKRLQLGTLGFA